MSGVSFGFTKKKEQKVLQTSVIADPEKKEGDERDSLTSYDENTGKRPKAEELVIPLIENNLWRQKRLNEESKSSEESAKKKPRRDGPEVELEGDDAAAAKELMEEAKMMNEDWDTRDGTKAPDMTIPILMRNKVPEGFETDDKLDVSLRPDGASDANYDTVPVESFGKAMLRGMGWKEGKGIGKNGELVNPVNAVLRPKGMGLGADRSVVEQLKAQKSGKSNGKQEKLEMKTGAYCVITSGKHENYYGQVQGLDEDNNRAFVKITITGEKVNVSQPKLQLVTSEDYKKNSKYINKSKAEEYHKETERKLMEKYEEENRSRKHKHKHKDQDREDERDRHRDRKSRKQDSDRSDNEDRDTERKSSKRKDRHSSKEDRGSSKHDRENGAKHKSSHNDSHKSRIWLRPNLRVRVIEEKYKKGKYYKEKVVVEDVISGKECICRTGDGKLLEGLTQDMLETVIPKSVPAIVMVVSGPHKTKLGELVGKDKTNYIATIQVLPDRDEVLQIDFDSICDYTGDTHTELNY